MGFLTWGEPERECIGEREMKVSDIRHSHPPDKRGERKDKYGRQPIDVDTSGRVIDGNDRLYYARQNGKKTIKVKVWK